MSGRRIYFEPAPWWPPTVGARLRGVWGPVDDGDPLLHVVAVFTDKDDSTRIVIAEWSVEKQRWRYDVRGAYDSVSGALRPDGAPRLSEKEKT